MVGSKRFEHARLFVEELGRAVEFYSEVMGLTEIERRNGFVYFGCGLDENYDLAVKEGGTGLDHFAVRVTDEEFRRYERSLRREGVHVERTDGAEPTQEMGLRFSLPMGATMEFVTVTDRRYHHANVHRLGNRNGITPLDIDHITFGASQIRLNAEFLRDTLGFNVSEVLKSDREWRGAFVHRGHRYHDIGFIYHDTAANESDMRHVAWTAANVDHLKRFVDHLATASIELEVALHRHYAGDALAAYFWEPGGNRFEICTEEAEVGTPSPTIYIDAERGYTAWDGANPPDSYGTGT